MPKLNKVQAAQNRLQGAMDAADEFMAVKAAAAEIAKKEARLKAVMLASGLAFVDGTMVIEGKLARVTISECEGRSSVDMDALRKLLSAEALKRVIKSGKPSMRFAAKARVADASVVVENV